MCENPECQTPFCTGCDYSGEIPPVLPVDKIILTDADRQRWRYMDNDDGRRAMCHVVNQSTERLQATMHFNSLGYFDLFSQSFIALLREFHVGTNPHWLAARVAEELYTRGVITEKELDRI
jgi:hypothetical protein